MFLIVGLGNPENRYNNTYHNMGFSFVDALSKKQNFEFTKKIGKSIVGEFYIDNEKVLVAKPLTYMNLSGEAVLSLKAKFKIPNQKILVVVDDIDLPIGTYRFKTGGSGGTHNGMRNIVSNIGADFPRIRIGIDKPENKEDLADYVLSKISGDNLEIITQVIDEVVDVAIDKVKEICSN